MIKVSPQTFSTASRRKSEINIRVSDLYDNFHNFFRFLEIITLSRRYRNNYCLNLIEFNCISQPYHSSISYIKGRFDFQARERERKRVQLLKETVLQYSTLMLSSRRDLSVDVLDNIYGCICAFFLQMFF